MKIDHKLQEKLGELFAAPVGETELPGALLMDIEKIHTAAQPRQYFDEVALKDLENSIRELHEAGKGIGATGILQPLLVRLQPSTSAGSEKKYVVTAGERRLRAAKSIGLKQIPVIVAEMSSEDAWEQAIIENLLRADLNPLEEAEALQKLILSRGYSIREAAKRLGKDKGYLENRLFLLKAPSDVRELVSARADTIRHAREISKITDVKIRSKLIEQLLSGVSLASIQKSVQRQGENANNSSLVDSSKQKSNQVGGYKEALTALEASLHRVHEINLNFAGDEEEYEHFVNCLKIHVRELQKIIEAVNFS